MKKSVSTLSDKLTENWLYKVVALIVALAVWGTTLYGRKDTLLIKTMEIEFVLRPNDIIANNYSSTVKVKVAGPRMQLNKFAMSASPIVVNLTNELEGEHVFPIRASDIVLPLGVKVLSISPNELHLNIQELRRASSDNK